MRIDVERDDARWVWQYPGNATTLLEEVSVGLVPHDGWPGPKPLAHRRDKRMVQGRLMPVDSKPQGCTAHIRVRPDGGTLTMDGHDPVDFRIRDLVLCIAMFIDGVHIADWGFNAGELALRKLWKAKRLPESLVPVSPGKLVESNGWLWPAGSALLCNMTLHCGDSGSLTLLDGTTLYRRPRAAGLAEFARAGKWDEVRAGLREYSSDLDVQVGREGLYGLVLTTEYASLFAGWDLSTVVNVTVANATLAGLKLLSDVLPNTLKNVVLTVDTDVHACADVFAKHMDTDGRVALLAPKLTVDQLAALPAHVTTLVQPLTTAEELLAVPKTVTSLTLEHWPTGEALQVVLDQWRQRVWGFSRAVPRFHYNRDTLRLTAPLLSESFAGLRIPSAIGLMIEGDLPRSALPELWSRLPNLSDLRLQERSLGRSMPVFNTPLPHLKTLMLLDCELSDADADALASLVANAPNLGKLSLSKNSLSKDTLQRLAGDHRLSAYDQRRIAPAEWKVSPMAEDALRDVPSPRVIATVWIRRMLDRLSTICETVPTKVHKRSYQAALKAMVKACSKGDVLDSTKATKVFERGPLAQDNDPLKHAYGHAWMRLGIALSSMEWGRKYDERDYPTDVDWYDVKREYNPNWLGEIADQAAILAGVAANWSNDDPPVVHADPAERERQLAELAALSDSA